MKKFQEKMQKIEGRYITDSHDMVNIYETREMGTMSSRDMETVSAVQHKGNFDSGEATREIETLKTNQKTKAAPAEVISFNLISSAGAARSTIPVNHLIYSIVYPVLTDNQKPAEAGIGESQSGTYKPNLDSNYSISDTELKSNRAVDSFSFPGPEGNRTPETRLSRSGSFQNRAQGKFIIT